MSSPPSTSDATRAGIVVDGVSHQFGDLLAVSDMSFTVAPGETVAVIGPSGCGKTTLLRTLAGLLAPSTGSVTLDGESPTEAHRRRLIGWVPQSPALLPWKTVAENVAVLGRVGAQQQPSTEATAVLLDQVGLSGFADALPHELSGGMQQRVSLARALALNAPFLLLDEPFGALDEITRTEMRHLLTGLCETRNVGAVLVTHSVPEAVFVADRIIVCTSRPARVAAMIDVDLPYPRAAEIEDSAAFFAATTAVRHALQAAMDGVSS